MSSVTTLTGRNGRVQIGVANATSTPPFGVLVARITRWHVTPQLAEVAGWADSDSAGYLAKAPGAFDAFFTTEGRYDTLVPVWNLWQPGDKLSVELWLNPNVPLLRWRFPSALCATFDLVVDVDTAEVIGWTSDWEADGAFLKPGQA